MRAVYQSGLGWKPPPGTAPSVWLWHAAQFAGNITVLVAARESWVAEFQMWHVLQRRIVRSPSPEAVTVLERVTRHRA